MLAFNQKNQKVMFDNIIHSGNTVKTFVFEQEETQQSHIVDYEIDARQKFINLNYLLSIYCSLQLHRVSIYDPNANRFVSFSKIGADNGYVHQQYLEPAVILLRHKRKGPETGDSDSIDSSREPDSSQERKDARSKERSLAEVIELVKRWRNLHLHGHKTLKRRLNLQDAAKLVGISKKSLDDYYCQLRLGEFYSFDFASNLQERMGVLRTFVKDHKDSKPEKDKRRRQNQQHPKNLRVIDQFQIETKTLIIPQYSDEAQEEVSDALERPISQQFEEQFNYQSDHLENLLQSSHQVFQELDNLEHEFFREFQLVLDDKDDPYMQIDRDFRKKDFDEQSNSYLYF